ncbi:MAG: trigger factor [Planctomycetota bacterium]
MSEPNAAPPSYPGLEVEVETTGPCVATVRFRVQKEEVRRMRAQGLRNLGKRARYKGFRPGKAPLQLLEHDFGARVDAELIELLVNRAYDTAVRRDGLRPAATPRVDRGDLAFDPEADFRHSFEVLLRPTIELGAYKGLEIEGTATEVAEAELEGAIEDFRRRESRAEPAGEEGLSEDGFASCRIEFLLPEEEAPVLDKAGIRLNPKTPLNGVDPALFAERLAAARAGEVRELEITYPADFPHEAARGRKGTVRLTLNEVLRIVPPTAEEFLRLVGAENEAEMREKLRARMAEAKEEHERQRIEMALIDRLVEQNPMEIADSLVDAQVDAKMAELRESLGNLKVAEAELEERLATERERAWEQTARAIRAVYIMEEVARLEGLAVTGEDVRSEMQAIAERNGTTLDEVRKYYREQGLLQQLGLELLERKVRSFLRESADIRFPGPDPRLSTEPKA